MNARMAGLTLLIYIAAGIAGLVLWQRASGGGDTAAILSAMVENPAPFRIVFLLDLLCSACALTLAATLYALTSAHGPSLAMMAMACRLAEGVLIASSLSDNLGAVWLAQQPLQDIDTTQLLAAYVLRSEVALTSVFFALGSLLFACLFVRGRVIPVPLAWLGVLASLTLVVVLPLQLVGWASGWILSAAWLPMLTFEVPLGLWLIFKGVRRP